MTEQEADGVVRWTARAAMGLYAAALAGDMPRRGGGRRRLQGAEIAYLVGSAVYLAHVDCAFALVHAGSHAAAYEHVARRTAEVVGRAWGAGLWFNYALTAVWTADAVWLVAAPHSYHRRARWIDAAVHGFLIFMAVNAVIVFGPPTTRWCGVAALAGVFWSRSRNRRGRLRPAEGASA